MTSTYRPEAEVAPVPSRSRVALVVSVVIVLIVGLVGGFFIGRYTKADLPSDLAPTSVTTLLTNHMKAFNRGDAAQIASYYATDATVTHVSASDPWTVKGSTKIGEAYASISKMLGMRMSNPGTAVQRGQLVVQPMSGSPSNDVYVYEITNGKIQNVWIVSDQ